MRRALLLILLGTPTFALAGTITASSSTINIAQCSGTEEDVLDLTDDMDVDLSWTVTAENGFQSDSVFRLYASRQKPAAGEDDAISCTEAVDGTPLPEEEFGQVGEDITATSLSSGGNQGFDWAHVVAATRLGCTTSDAAPRTIYLCVQYLVGDEAQGWATTTVRLDTRRPGAPTNVTVSPGDRSLRINCTGASSTTSFRATATPVGGGAVRRSNQETSCGSLRFTGLTNDTTYDVTVYGINAANNRSENGTAAASGPLTTPVPTDDFWDEYEGEPGAREQGGCNSGAGAAGILSALSLIAAAAAARRRKP